MAEKRRRARINYAVTIQLVSMPPGNRGAVAQSVLAIDISEHGALLECRSKFDVGAEVMIHNPANPQNGLFKVVRATVSPSGSAWHVSIELHDPTPNFWGK